MAVDIEARGAAGFVARRLQTLSFLLGAFRFVFFYLTTARAVRRRYAKAERTGGVIWLDRGPFAPGSGSDGG